MNTKPMYDVCYYWVGTRTPGEWRLKKPFRQSVDDTFHALRAQRRVAVRGNTWMGPPEGPPSPQKFEEVGL